jgi:peptide/nickel transport system substrate-binding protein
VLGVVVVGGGSLLAACTSDGEPGATVAGGSGPIVPTDLLRARISIDLKNADPGDVYDAPDGTAVSLAYENLVRYAPDSKDLQNWLAVEWESSDDFLRWHFKLQEGVLFHGGYGEMTAEDVKYSFERIAGLTDPKEDHSYQSDWGALKGVEVDGKYQGTVVLNETYAPLMTTTVPASVGSIVSKAAVADLGDELRVHPIGTGPYELVERTPKERILFRRFEDYWGEPPVWDEIELVIIPEPSATEIALETGEVDYALIGRRASERLAETGDFQAQEHTTFDWLWVGMNMINPKLEDINVRQAIRYAIDVPGIIEAAFEGGGERARAAISSQMPIGFWEDAPLYEQDLDKAREYMAASGVEGLELEIAIGSVQTYKIAAEIVQANLAEIGITVTINQDDAKFDLGPGLRELELFITVYYGFTDPVWTTQWFRCSQFDKWNWMYFCNDEYDDLDRAATRELDPEKRNEMYIQEQELMDEAVVAVWLIWPTSTSVTRTGIRPSFDVANAALLWNFKSA